MAVLVVEVLVVAVATALALITSLRWTSKVGTPLILALYTTLARALTFGKMIHISYQDTINRNPLNFHSPTPFLLCPSPLDEAEDTAAATTAPFVRFANGIINETNALVAGTIKVCLNTSCRHNPLIDR